MAWISGKLGSSTSRLALLFLLLTTIALSWFYQDTFNKHKVWMGRFAAANAVLDDYQNVARLAVREINILNDRLEGGEPRNTTYERELILETLQEAVHRLRQGTTAGVGSIRDTGQDQLRETALEIGRLVEELIGASALINQALNESRIDAATIEWKRLKDSGMPGDFAKRVDRAIKDQEREVYSISRQAPVGAGNIRSLPLVLILVIALISATVAMLSFRAEARSVHALKEAARAFASGDLSHRIPKLTSGEFSRLAEALNTMAAEMTDLCTRLRAEVTRMEKTIEDRNRELAVSNQRLAKTDVDRQKLLSNISHEFRTPLTVIRGQADIVLRGGGKTEAEYREAIERIRHRATVTTELLDDLLFMARADAGVPRLNMESVSIDVLIDSVCEEFQATAQLRGLLIEQRTMDRNAMIHGDAKQLWRVFAILLDNALRYSSPGGKVEVSATIAKGEVQIEFRDYGIGLTEKDEELAFDRFYRGQRAQEHSGGTGLGLSVAKAIVEAHNGSISLSGEPDAGTVARVTFPLEKPLKART
jgi:signal transduction histidine kinase